MSWLQSLSVVILKPPKIKSATVSPSVCHEIMGPVATIFIFECCILNQLFHCPFHLHQEAFQFLFAFCHKGGIICMSAVIAVSPAILIPAWALSSPAFLMMYSAYKLNKQNNNIQPWRTPFPIWNQSVVPSPVLTVASWPAYRFLRRQVRSSGIPISWKIFQFVVITLSLWINLEKTYMLMLLRL